jgi:AcrR family transcriptional regulator
MRATNRPVPAERGPARKGSYHHGDLRRALLDATLRLVEERGPQGFTLRAAARAAGVTPGATYHHFEDKDALLAAVAEEGFAHFRAALEAAAERPASTPRERSRNVGVGYVLFAVRHPTRFRVMMGYGVRARARHGGPSGPALATYGFVRDVLVAGLETTPAHTVTEAEVLGWWSVVHGLAFLAIDGHLGEVGTSERRAEIVVREVILALDERATERTPRAPSPERRGRRALARKAPSRP